MSQGAIEGEAASGEATPDAASSDSHEISFELGVQSLIDASSHAHARAVGSLRFMHLLPLAGALLGLTTGLVLEPSIQTALFFINPALAIVFMQLGSAVTVALALVGYAVGTNLASMTYHRRYLFGMYERGMPAQVTARYRLTNDALEAGNDRMTYCARWPAIAELVETPSAWVVVADMTTFVIPKSAFADENAQRGFVQSLLDRLSPAARDRSAEARAFVG